MTPSLTLISHRLCPYVQRAVIALAEKQVPFERIDIDLANTPDWFLALSPLGKTPVLKVGETPIFESAVILEYLEETAPNPLHPADPLTRAEHRGFIEFGSVILNDIGGLYSAPDEAAFEAKRRQLADRFAAVERRLGAGPFFAAAPFSLVDAVFGPVFRYFDTFERFVDLHIFDTLPRVSAWRRVLSERASVRGAVSPDYPTLLETFLRKRGSHLSRVIEAMPI